jgi:hypothetical protein
VAAAMPEKSRSKLDITIHRNFLLPDGTAADDKSFDK